MSVSRADIEKIIQIINSGDVESLKSEEFDQFQYQGFDPLKIVQTLYKIKTEKSISDADFMRDIFTMVAIGMIKGNVNDHNMTKMSDEGQKGIQSLEGKYGLKRGGGKSRPSNEVTYPRVMATFPDISIRMVKVIGPKEFRGGPMVSTRLPSYLQVQVFPAVIPRDLGDNAKRSLLTASLCYTIDQSIQISNIQKPDLKALAQNQLNFTMVGHNSPVPFPDVRKSVFSSLPLSADFNKIESVLKTYKEKIDGTFEIPTREQFITDVTISS
jgi:hypothetical protein